MNTSKAMKYLFKYNHFFGSCLCKKESTGILTHLREQNTITFCILLPSAVKIKRNNRTTSHSQMDLLH